jgi:hypothetical protein
MKAPTSPTRIGEVRTGRGGFFEWVSGIGSPLFDSSDSSVGPTASAHGSIGGASFLFAAPLPDSPFTVDLNRPTEAPPLMLTAEEKARLDELTLIVHEGCRRRSWTDDKKVSPIRVLRPVPDAPVVTVDWCVEPWSRARAFHKLLEEDRALWQRLASKALAVHEGGLAFPGITCCHCIVRTADCDRRSVLLCQRQRRSDVQTGTPTDTYHPNRWSISFEEQVNVGESLLECVERGLKEELLGPKGLMGVTSRILALAIEKDILNLTLIVLVDVPLTLDQIIKQWQSAVDRDEHRQLATLLLNREVLRTMSLGALSPRVIRDMRPSHPDVFANTSEWKLHPTSAARAAVSLWAQEATH